MLATDYTLVTRELRKAMNLPIKRDVYVSIWDLLSLVFPWYGARVNPDYPLILEITREQREYWRNRALPATKCNTELVGVSITGIPVGRDKCMIVNTSLLLF
jgi:hypothetical protein